MSRCLANREAPRLVQDEGCRVVLVRVWPVNVPKESWAAVLMRRADVLLRNVSDDTLGSLKRLAFMMVDLEEVAVPA